MCPFDWFLEVRVASLWLILRSKGCVPLTYFDKHNYLEVRVVSDKHIYFQDLSLWSFVYWMIIICVLVQFTNVWEVAYIVDKMCSGICLWSHFTTIDVYSLHVHIFFVFFTCFFTCTHNGVYYLYVQPYLMCILFMSHIYAHLFPRHTSFTQVCQPGCWKHYYIYIISPFSQLPDCVDECDICLFIL